MDKVETVCFGIGAISVVIIIFFMGAIYGLNEGREVYRPVFEKCLLQLYPPGD